MISASGIITLVPRVPRLVIIHVVVIISLPNGRTSDSRKPDYCARNYSGIRCIVEGEGRVLISWNPGDRGPFTRHNLKILIASPATRCHKERDDVSQGA